MKILVNISTTNTNASDELKNVNNENKTNLKSIKNAVSSQLQQKLNFKTKEYENNTDSSDMNDVSSDEISILSRKQISQTNTRIFESPSLTKLTTLKIPLTIIERYELESNTDEISRLTPTTTTTTKKKSSIFNKNLNKTARHRKRLGMH